jgi:hypothetical protein
MTEVLVFKFPDLKSENRTIIERKYCEVLHDYREGVILEPEVLDWFDSANSFLATMESK